MSLTPGERRTIAWVVAAGFPSAFAVGALLAIFSAIPPDPAPLAAPPPVVAGQGPPNSSVAPPSTSTGPPTPARVSPGTTTRRVVAADRTVPRTRTPAPTTSTPTPAALYWTSCPVAHAAGASNIPRGAPGYRIGLDRDGDDLACDVELDSPGEPAATTTTEPPAPAVTTTTETPQPWTAPPVPLPVG